MEFEVDRNDLHRTRVVDDPVVELPAGAARLRIDAFALTSNNIIYAAFREMMQYWSFFPASPKDPDGTNWGRVPVWGFAEVVESAVGDLAIGRRVYGFPMATEVVVEPGRFDARGFIDLAAHRAPMAAAYNRYQFTDADPMYRPDRESQQMVLWPLFFTSFLIDDFIDDNEMFGASTVVVSSASSKTAIGTAHLLAQRNGLQIVGLTTPVFFFAPSQIAKRTKEWGSAERDQRVGKAWRRYSTWTDGWITFDESRGPGGVATGYHALVGSRVDPRLGSVCSMWAS